MKRLLTITLMCCLCACGAKTSGSNPRPGPGGNGAGDSGTAPGDAGDKPGQTADAGLDAGPVTQDGPGRYKLGKFDIEVRADGSVNITHADAPDRSLWQTVVGNGFSESWIASDKITESRGSFKIEETVEKRCGEQGSVTASQRGDVVTLKNDYKGTGCDGWGATLALKAISESALSFTLKPFESTPKPTRIVLVYAAEAAEGFYGFGEQFTYVNLRGREVPILVQEQGIGRAPGVIATAIGDSAGSWYTTYDAVPFYLTDRGRSFMLENNEVSWFDLTAADRVKVRLRGTELKGRILFGQKPLDVIEAFTEYTGRMKALPAWMNRGAIIGMQGGTARVREVLAQLDANDTPIGGFWLQDWVGKRNTGVASQLWWNWQLNDEQYPGWATLVSDLEKRDIRLLTYVNPFLVDVDGQSFFSRNLYREARDAGYLVKDQVGMPYAIQNTTFSAGLLDLTNPEATSWFEKVLVDEVLAVGASGYMADFGEALPFDAVLASGEDAATYHNYYPEAWQKLHRELFEREGLIGDAVFFTRSGYTKSPGLSTLFWLGDQTVNWDGDDGLYSAIKGMLSGGLSGISLNHSDIGGYVAIPVLLSRSAELLKRWSEMAAFTAVYRTHEGTQPDGNVQFYDDASSLAHFAKFARLYAALSDYRATLMKEAEDKGYPLARHLLLEYSDDPMAWKQDIEFMLGRDVLMVPVIEQGATKVNAYVPQGEWVHLYSGKAYQKGTYEIAAPIGQPAVFYRKGSAAGAALEAAL